MSDVLSSMNDDEVRQIALLVETLDKSTFDYLQIVCQHRLYSGTRSVTELRCLAFFSAAVI
jgi:hypothetical protein